MHCLTPIVLAALAGHPYAPADLDPQMLTPPAELDGRPRRYAEGKGIYGTPLAHHVDGPNFTVQWREGASDEAYARTVLDTLEAGWSALIDAGGWPAPVSSDRYLLWVVLDPTIRGSGYTTTYASAEFPDGYPVTYVAPGFGDADYPGYSRSVAVHEFGHMIQYGVRDWNSSDAESWYWEASAEWMADQGVPDLDTYALSTYWYADSPEAAYDSTADYHAYGMLLLPRYIDDALGAEAVQRGWVDNGGADWPDAIAAGAGQDLGTLIPEMAGAYAAGALTDAAAFYTPDPRTGAGSDDAGGLYGTRYVAVARADAERFGVTGPAVVRYAASGRWSEAPPDADSIAAITRTGAGTIAWGPVDPGDTAAEDTARHDTASGDTAADDPAGGGRAPAACGCATGVRAPAGLGLAGIGWVAARRRRLLAAEDAATTAGRGGGAAPGGRRRG